MNNKNIYLSSNLKYLRQQKGMTQEDVSKYCEKGNTAISNWEKGLREPDAVDLAKLSTLFNVSVDDFMLKDLRFEDKSNDELEILFSKNREILTNDDLEMIKFVIEKRKKEIDKEIGKE